MNYAEMKAQAEKIAYRDYMYAKPNVGAIFEDKPWGEGGHELTLVADYPYLIVYRFGSDGSLIDQMPSRAIPPGQP